MQKTRIYEITPFTMLDYPGKTACIVWFAGCNMRCIYCYNKQVVTSTGRIQEEILFDFLRSRVGKLEGVVFSGGECTLNPHFLTLARKIKDLGFLIKVDTNGSNPQKIQAAVKLGLIDKISLDFKADEQNFEFITSSNLYNKFLQTLKFLIAENFDFEVRTTVHADFMDEKTVEKMAKFLEDEGYKGVYYLQNFLSTGENFGCLEAPIANFNTDKIKTNLRIELRNF